jgi:hypothetical protein
MRGVVFLGFRFDPFRVCLKAIPEAHAGGDFRLIVAKKKNERGRLVQSGRAVDQAYSAGAAQFKSMLVTRLKIQEKPLL